MVLNCLIKYHYILDSQIWGGGTWRISIWQIHNTHSHSFGTFCSVIPGVGLLHPHPSNEVTILVEGPYTVQCRNTLYTKTKPNIRQNSTKTLRDHKNKTMCWYYIHHRETLNSTDIPLQSNYQNISYSRIWAGLLLFVTFEFASFVYSGMIPGKWWCPPPKLVGECKVTSSGPILISSSLQPFVPITFEASMSDSHYKKLGKCLNAFCFSVFA